MKLKKQAVQHPGASDGPTQGSAPGRWANTALQADLVAPLLPEGHPDAGQEILPLPPCRWRLTQLERQWMSLVEGGFVLRLG